MMTNDTIAAVATAPGRGGIGIIRLSGPMALQIAGHVLETDLQPRYAHYCTLRDSKGEVLDTGLAIYFPAPNSFTGEDVIELQMHGSPVVLDLIMSELLRGGARSANPGEFSERAFLNSRLDLAQAEAIADLINSTTEKAARSASRSLQGEFSREIDAIVGAVTALRVYVEASIDFAEEEIDFLGDGAVDQRLSDIADQFCSLQQAAKQGSLLQEGMKLVIAGRPNAGKSSLMNVIAGRDAAIVTPLAGTTRDVLREHVQIDGLPLHLVDTAGLHDSVDPIEQEGIRRARLELNSADRVLLVIDSSLVNNEIDLTALTKEVGIEMADVPPITLLHNKIDLSGESPRILELDNVTHIYLSAKTGDGFDLLRAHLKQCCGYESEAAGNFSARRRHLDALARANQCIDSARHQLGNRAGELMAEDLKQCQQSLGEITGVISNDELLGKIFSSFCIGK
ncbi:MAG: tRNA uridine-5-carboxymethylaminomethyl(34) synthesis GTPase MnmE [Pseudomonadota bacterium]